jgi:low temperature requirement protein LtrA
MSDNGNHRVATTLELFYDLAIVLAIAAASGPFHHSLAENHIGSGILHFVMAFFALWWAWVNFPWFASAHDTNDVIYKVTVFVKVTGALVLAAGLPGFFTENRITLVLVGFCIMRLALLSLWFRVALRSKADRVSALRNVVGIALCQIGWIVLVLFFSGVPFLVGFLILACAELFVPYFARKAASGAIHIDHISERHGLLAIIALGECLLAITMGISALWNHFSSTLMMALLGSLIMAFSMWALYFEKNDLYLLRRRQGSFVWGYLHFFLYLAIAAIGSGMSVIWAQIEGHTSISPAVSQAAIALPLALYLLVIWLLREAFSPEPLHSRVIIPVFAAVILGLIFLPDSLLIMGFVTLLLVYLRRKF